MKLKQPLTDDQRTMVEDAIPLAKWCVQKYTISNEHICGLTREDLTQEAYIALCQAAATYKNGRVQFNTYAVTVIRNHLIDYCKKINTEYKYLSVCSLDAPRDDDEDNDSNPMISDKSSNFEDDSLSRLWTKELLRERKRNYCGCARQGVEALELKALYGYGVTDIAQLYKVKPTLVGAWISRAAQKLRQDMSDVEWATLGVEKNKANS